jgi:hypothetical protein
VKQDPSARCVKHDCDMFWVDQMVWICPLGEEVMEMWVIGGSVVGKLPQTEGAVRLK